MLTSTKPEPKTVVVHYAVGRRSTTVAHDAVGWICGAYVLHLVS